MPLKKGPLSVRDGLSDRYCYWRAVWRTWRLRALVTTKGFLECARDSPVTCGPTIGFKQGMEDAASAIRELSYMICRAVERPQIC